MPQKITTFVAGDFPAAVALAIDRSFSMAGKPLTMARTAGRAFVGRLKPDDRAMLISISGEVEVLAPLSDRQGADPEGARRTRSVEHDLAARRADPLARSARRRNRPPRHRRAVRWRGSLQHGDGRRMSWTRARRSDVLMYPIAIGRERPALFAELAAVTGGRSFHLQRSARPAAHAAGDCRGPAVAVPDRLRARGEPAGGGSEWRSITVQVNRPGCAVRARSGYSTR